MNFGLARTTLSGGRLPIQLSSPHSSHSRQTQSPSCASAAPVSRARLVVVCISVVLVRHRGVGSDRGLASGVDRDAASQSRRLVEEVFRRDYATLVRAAWMLGGSREVGEDVVQEVFAQMLRSPHLASVDDPGGYAYRAVINRLRSWQRRQALERRHAHLRAEPVTAGPEVSAVSEYLEALSERQRTAVVLRFYCDLPLAEVAALMGCRRGTVSVLLRRALGKARTMKEVFLP